MKRKIHQASPSREEWLTRKCPLQKSFFMKDIQVSCWAQTAKAGMNPDLLVEKRWQIEPFVKDCCEQETQRDESLCIYICIEVHFRVSPLPYLCPCPCPCLARDHGLFPCPCLWSWTFPFLSPSPSRDPSPCPCPSPRPQLICK